MNPAEIPSEMLMHRRGCWPWRTRLALAGLLTLGVTTVSLLCTRELHHGGIARGGPWSFFRTHGDGRPSEIEFQGLAFVLVFHLVLSLAYLFAQRRVETFGAKRARIMSFALVGVLLVATSAFMVLSIAIRTRVIAGEQLPRV